MPKENGIRDHDLLLPKSPNQADSRDAHDAVLGDALLWIISSLRDDIVGLFFFKQTRHASPRCAPGRVLCF